MDLHAWATAILNHAVQLTLLTALVWCAAKLFARNRPHVAHALWILVLIKCVVPPAWSSPTSLFNLNALNFVSIPTDPSQNQSHATHDNSSIANDTGNVNELIANSSDIQLLVDVGVENETPINSESIETPRFTDPKPSTSWQPFLKVPQSASAFGVCTLVIGFAAGLLITCARLLWFIKAAYAKGYYSDAEIDDLVCQLSKRLGVKRLVTVRLVRNPIGPVVLGLIRPTLLLPDLIVRGKKLSELEPLIAHELIHVRRGDLWWSMLQAVATSLWWFHPLVRLAGRMVSRETERSCDEETVACLGCSPATYARSLLDVLERKHQLQIAPALPGVRPIEVTLDRMERIMKLGQGSHKRTPRWIWAAMLVACAVALPSGSVGVAQESRKSDSYEPEQATAAALKATSNAISPWVSYREDIGNLIDALKDRGMNAGEAQRWILAQLPSCTQEIAGVENARFKRFTVGGVVNSDLLLKGQITLADEPSPQIVDRELRASDTQEKIDEVKTKLQFLRKTCKKHVSCEVKTIRLKKDDFEEVSANWSLTGKNPNGVQIIVDGKEVAVARPSIDTRIRAAFEDVHMWLAFKFARPCSYSLDEEEFDAILRRKDIRSVTAPRVTGRSGQTVTMSFQSDSKADEENFLQGTSLELTPTIIEGDRISLRTKCSTPSINEEHFWNDAGGHGKRVLDAMRNQNPSRRRLAENITASLALAQYEDGRIEEAAETFNDLLDTFPDSELHFLTTEAPIERPHVICLPSKVDGEAGVLVVLVKCSVVDPPKDGDSASFEKTTADMNGFVNVGGAVKRPDRYELDEPTNVAQAIAAAGGMQVPGSELNAVVEVIILRQFNGTYILSKFTLDRSQLGTETTRADVLWLKKNDIVFVKPASSAITRAQAKALSSTNQQSIFEHIPVIGPTTAGLVHKIPRLENHEVMHALNNQREANGKYALDSEQYSRIEIEELAESKDEKRFIPLIGDAVLCHTFYKCTVYLNDSDERHVVFIDHNHFHTDW